MIPRALCLLLLCSRLLGAGAFPESGEARTERLLTAIGGRSAWSAVRSYMIRATHYEGNRAPFANTIWNDLAVPRVRIEAKGPDVDVRRAIDGEQAWRTRDGQITPLTPEQIRDEQRWWEANIYRTLQRLAARDAELSVRAVGENRLEVFRADGARLNWFELNARGEPLRFGTWESETGSVFGPLIQQGPVKCAKWGTNATGTWRYEVVELIVSEQPSDAPFDAP